MSFFGEHHQSFSSHSFACCLLYLNTTVVLGTSLVWVSLHSNNREQGLISWLVFQAGRHLAPAAQLLVAILSFLSKLCICRHFPKLHAVLQMSNLSYLLPVPGGVVVASASGLPFLVPFCLCAFPLWHILDFLLCQQCLSIVHLPQSLCWAG